MMIFILWKIFSHSQESSVQDHENPNNNEETVNQQPKLDFPPDSKQTFLMVRNFNLVISIYFYPITKLHQSTQNNSLKRYYFERNYSTGNFYL
jgi:hypothetical protein